MREHILMLITFLIVESSSDITKLPYEFLELHFVVKLKITIYRQKT